MSGNVICHTNFNGVVMTNEYDVMNRLTSKTSAGGYKVLYDYNSTGLQSWTANGESETEYHYDALNRLARNVLQDRVEKNLGIGLRNGMG